MRRVAGAHREPGVAQDAAADAIATGLNTIRGWLGLDYIAAHPRRFRARSPEPSANRQREAGSRLFGHPEELPSTARCCSSPARRAR